MQIATWKLAIRVSTLLKPRTWKWIAIGQLLAAALLFSVYGAFPARKQATPLVLYDQVTTASDPTIHATVQEMKFFRHVASTVVLNNSDIGWNFPSIPNHKRDVVVQLTSSDKLTLLESTAKLLLVLQSASMTLGALVSAVIAVLAYNRANAEIRLKEMELKLKIAEIKIKEKEIRLKELQIMELELKVDEMGRARVDASRNTQTSRIVLLD